MKPPDSTEGWIIRRKPSPGGIRAHAERLRFRISKIHVVYCLYSISLQPWRLGVMAIHIELKRAPARHFTLLGVHLCAPARLRASIRRSRKGSACRACGG